jgi:drug/metabolite transporter (DMT)-like permease
MKQSRLFPIIGMVICTFFSAFASYFLKKASEDITTSISSWLSINFFIAIFLYFFGFLILLISIKNGQVSKLHGIMSLSYVWVLFIGYFLLSEHISIVKIISIILIIIGVFCVTWQK